MRSDKKLGIARNKEPLPNNEVGFNKKTVIVYHTCQVLTLTNPFSHTFRYITAREIDDPG